MSRLASALFLFAAVMIPLSEVAAVAIAGLALLVEGALIVWSGVADEGPA